MEQQTEKKTNFIRQIIDADLAAGNVTGQIVTRFPPEPNGYLHIGHAKSICLNFGIAEDYQGRCNLRFDDTNPHKENEEFVEAIKRDVEWLGFSWHGEPRFASDYFERLYDFAVELIGKGKAYVCDLPPEKMREYRGTLTEPGRESPYRNRPVEENLDLFRRMRAGEFPDGSKTLRARIDMASPNINLRDPVLYRIRHGVIHHQTGTEWCLYPMYDYTHPISDAIEGVTHSLCTLEFEDHRPLYDWVLDNISIGCHPRQIEFSRLNLQYTVTSKRKLTELVEEGYVEGWDDPRMPTIAGMRRRGYSPASIREFCERIGVTKSDNSVEMAQLEDCVRDDLNASAPRRMAVLHPLKVIITNYPEGQAEELEAPNHPQEPSMGMRKLPFTRELWIERDDFREQANKKYKRLVPGGVVRLRNAYLLRADEVIKNPQGGIVELRCTYFPESLGANIEGIKARGVIHWLSAEHAVSAELRLYDRLFAQPMPGRGGEGSDYRDHLNPDSLRTLTHSYVEPLLAGARAGDTFQFERQGYFCMDPARTADDRPIFNRTVGLRDSWARLEKK